MKINSNITAYLTNNAYAQSEMKLANSTAKLSSGFKLNKSGDDPANYAIAAKMRSMIKGLEKVKVNTTTGISVIQTAEAAMVETQSMVQRMNELAIKSSNGTLSSSDRTTLQDELNQLLKEIDRIAESTEFNGTKLLDGTMQNKGYTNKTAISVMDYTEETVGGKYLVKLTKDADGNYSIDDVTGGTTDPAAQALYDKGYKKASDLFGTVDPTRLRIISDTVPHDDGSFTDYVTIKGLDGVDLRLKTENGVTDNKLELDLTGLGAMRLQVGTEEGEVINASFPTMTVEAMGLAGIDLSSEESSHKAIDLVNDALNYVNSARSRLGAYQNRLENTSAFIDTYNEDITTSLSRIQDTDMAEEMIEFTNKQILTQAGISMLSQANEAPQQALQLLQ
ncbi:MAG: hypothetical protein K6E90_04590 [Lachnospiraceae bacterium]|nr:hypothetical protein [Lachnospiraceae bacterium]